MLLRFVKRNSILLVFLALYLLVVAMGLIEIDKQYYQRAKKTLITEYDTRYLWNPIGMDLRNTILNHAEAVLLSDSPAANQNLLRQIHQILDDENNPVYRIVLKDGSQDGQGGVRIDIVRENKYRLRNNWHNSLFLRDFSEITKSGFPTVQGKLEFHYTNPLGDEQIHELTIRYRWYAAFFVLVLTLLAAALYRSLLNPLNNVLTALESTSHDRTAFCPLPRSRLEALYNRMALGAVISRLQSRLREEIARNPQITGWEAVGFVCRAFGEQSDLPLVGCLEMVAKGPGDIQATGRHVFSGSWLSKQRPHDLAGRIDQGVPRDGRSRVPFDLADARPPLEGELMMIADPDRSGFRYLFAVLLEARHFEISGQTLEALLQGLNELVETALQSLALRNQLVVKERGRANISLSRNLGHDLTNIIATSKLDLMALERLLRKGSLPDDARRQAILAESLAGLLKSIRFMQETVNLYRAYAFLQHPVLETHDGNALIADTLDLFTLSISAKMEVHRKLADDAPRCVVDPRLIKLALFNMFSNSMRAIRKTDPESFSASGWIKVLTRKSRDGGLCIAVEDSGTGIVDAAGRKLEPHEIEKIFELGYSSRDNEEESGEGLGLNWVRTIIQDLHGGAILAENTPDHGARFVIVFPPIDHAPDMENAERKAKEYMSQFQRKRDTPSPTDR